MLHGFTPPHRFLHYLSWPQIAQLPDRANTVIVLPVGSIEQHGPHLPCAVDTLIAAGVVGHALARLPESVPAFGMSPISYGKSDEHIHFPGTMTIDGETLLHTITDIGESVYRSGFRKLLIVNGHGGQPQVMEMAARTQHGEGGRRVSTRVPVEDDVGRWTSGGGVDRTRFRSIGRHRRSVAGDARAGAGDPRFAGDELGQCDHRVSPDAMGRPRRSVVGDVESAGRYRHALMPLNSSNGKRI